MGVKAAFFPKFKKTVAMIGSDREAERHTAADLAFRMCEDNDLSLQEAFEGAFQLEGGEQSQVQHLETRNAELESDNRKLSDALAELHQQQIDMPEDAGEQLVKRLMMYPQAWLVALLLFFVVRLWVVMYCIHEVHLSARFALVLEGALDGFSLTILVNLFCKWAEAEFIRRGVGVVVVKGVVIVVGFYFATSDFYATGYVRSWLTTNKTFFSNAWPWAVWIGAVTLPNAASWLCTKLAHSDEKLYAKLREWFA